LTDKSNRDQTERRIEQARKSLFGTLDALRGEADAVAAAIEDELIALRISLLRGAKL
jgi:hypothetical protein